MRELLRDREYLAYFVARQSARFGYSIESVAVGWQIYTLRHNAFDIGLAGLVLFVPQLLLAIPSGVLADRFDRRMVCMLCAFGEVAAELAFVAVILTGTRSLALNLCAIELIGIAHSIGDPAERALLASVVEGGRYVRAQALSTSVSEVITIVGPALGGVLIAGGVPLAFVAAAVFYAIGAIAFSFLTPRERSATVWNPKPRWTAFASSSVIRSCSGQSRSICSRCCLEARPRCCRSSPSACCTSGRSASVRCVARRPSVPRRSPPTSRVTRCRERPVRCCYGASPVLA